MADPAASFAPMHRSLLAMMGQAAVYTPVAGEPRAVQVLLDEQAAELGEFGVVVARRPAISVMQADVPAPTQGDYFDLDGEQWQLVSVAERDGMIIRLWVESA